ncbi:MAG: hypothetical protein FWE38_00590 [Firmicutes bacterium]|nr:hypothetical protein [Bacillota bacterium]
MFSNCSEPVIKSHTIQNNGILDRLAVDGHVYETDGTAPDGYPKIELKKIGRNETSLFRCLCNRHDAELFAPIEKQPYIGSDEQNLLYSFRSILFSLWKATENRNYWKTEYFDKYNIFHDFFEGRAGGMYEQFILSNIAMQDDYARIRMLHDKYMRAVEERDFSILTHRCFELDYEIGFACCSLLYTNTLPNGGAIDPNLVAEVGKENYYPQMTVACFPNDGKTHIICSWLNEDIDNAHYGKFFAQMRTTKEVLDVFNIMLPTITEEIYYSPVLIDSLTPKAKAELCRVAGAEPMLVGQYINTGYQWLNKKCGFDLFRMVRY